MVPEVTVPDGMAPGQSLGGKGRGRGKLLSCGIQDTVLLCLDFCLQIQEGMKGLASHC